jgi:hypothetical protein
MNGTTKNFAGSIQTLRKAAVIGASAAAFLMLGTSAQATSFTNGSFEINTGNGQLGIGGTTTATGWSVPAGGYTFLFAPGTADTTGANGEYGNLALWGPGYGVANGMPATSPVGGYFIGQDSAFQVQPLQQTITGLTAGDTYALSFYWGTAQQTGFYGATYDSWLACLGVECDSTGTVANPSQGFEGWYGETFVYTAIGPSEILTFLASGGDCCGNTNSQPPFVLLDGVSLTQTPEPGSLPLFFTGLMGGLGVLRSRKWLKR